MPDPLPFPPHLRACLPARPPALLPACPPTCLPACLPAGAQPFWESYRRNGYVSGSAYNLCEDWGAAYDGMRTPHDHELVAPFCLPEYHPVTPDGEALQRMCCAHGGDGGAELLLSFGGYRRMVGSTAAAD